jgi:long-chain acyl-CoA synthetase
MSKSREWNFAGCLIRRLGDRSHLIDAATGESLRGQAVGDSVVRYAQQFVSVGLKPRDRLMIGCGVSPASTLAYLGAMYCGLTPVPIENRALATFGEALFRKAKAKALWVGEGVRCAWARKNEIVTAQGCFGPQTAGSLPPALCEEDDIAALMPTSGSTGVPRLVAVSHKNLIANTEAIVRSQDLGADESAMLVMPVSYCFGASVMHTHLYQGGGVVFDSRFMFPDRVLRAINPYRCTTFAGVPTVYNILLRRSNLKSIPMPTLRRFLQAGGALAPERVREMRSIAPKTKFFVMYGQTEATARISCVPPCLLDEKPGSAGLPLDNLEVRIVNDEGRELPRGQSGELQVRGPSVCSGYLYDSQATRRKFSQGWLRTGDFARLDRDGFLWIEGRNDEFIKSRGLRVSFAEVEARVAAIPGIYECAAVSVEHPEAGEALALFVVADRSDNGLAEKVRHDLPPQWTCASVKIVAELPKTSNGKIARFQLSAIQSAN